MGKIYFNKLNKCTLKIKMYLVIFICFIVTWFKIQEV